MASKFLFKCKKIIMKILNRATCNISTKIAVYCAYIFVSKNNFFLSLTVLIFCLNQKTKYKKHKKASTKKTFFVYQKMKNQKNFVKNNKIIKKYVFIKKNSK